MGKFLNFFFSRILIFAICVIGFSFAFDNFFLNLCVSLIITFMLSLTIDKLKDKIKLSENSYSKFVRHSIFYGNSEICNTLEKLISEKKIESKKDNYLVIVDKERNLIVSSVKYGAVTPDEIIRYRNIAKDNSCQRIYLISRNIDRKTAIVATNIDIPFMFIPLHYYYKILKKNKLIPTFTKQDKKTRNPIRFIVGSIFSRNNAKRFIFVAVILLLLSFITPLRTYYLVIASISLVLSLICLTEIGSKVNYGKHGIFDDMYNHKKKDN